MIAEIQAPTEDVQWVKVKYIRAPQHPELVGAEDLCSADEIRRVESTRGPHIHLALVMEAALQRLLAASGSTSSYQEVLDDLASVLAVRFEARQKAWLWRTELPGVANDAFRAVGLRPPPRVQALS